MSNIQQPSARARWFFAVALGGAVLAFFLPPMRQPQSYHNFADSRTLLGIPNCLNVLSNVPFLLAGLVGFGVVIKRPLFVDPGERWAWAVFFLGACATCFGSGYYHWAPSDATLAWDRLPMTLAFMSLLAAMISERISLAVGAILLWPLVLAGAASVGWWRWTGNLWPYVMAQYFSILLIGCFMLLFPPRYTRSADMLVVTGIYVLAKIAEALDRQIYALTGCVSGHTIKHLIAAGAVFWVLRMLLKRGPQHGREPLSQALPP